MKFGFKKKDAGASGEAKPSKRKSRSGGNGMASMKTFFADHGEKIVFGLIVGVSAYIIYSGFSKSGLESEPEDVKTAITRATGVINAETWPEVKSVRHPEPDTFKQQATEDTIDISAEEFQMDMPWHPVLQAQRERRKDPDLIAPLELEVRAGYGPMSAIERAGGGGISDLMRQGSADETRPLPDKYRLKQGTAPGGRNVESRFFVSVTGLVPVRQQQELYKAALSNAIEYEMERDSPRYLAVDIERREMKSDGTPGEWVNLSSPRAMSMEPKQWEGRSEERASSEHIIPKLVMPLPPLLFRDISKWALHSKIPAATEDDMGVTRDDVSDAGAVEEDSFDFFWDGEDAVDDRTEHSADDHVDDSRDYATAENQLTVEHGLLRFFDFQVKPGKTYEYRARFFLEDPNNPRNYQRPSENACEVAVIERRLASPNKKHRETPWSDTSRAVQVASGRSVYAGPVVAPTLMKANARISLPRRATDEPEATVMAVTWNAKDAMDVPSPVSVRRGSVVNQKLVDVWAVDPAKSNLRLLKGHSFSTNALVVDIAGGELLERRGREEVRAPGMVLMMDSLGNLSFHNEIQDFDDFDYYTIPPDEDNIDRFTPADEDESREDRPGRGGGRAGGRGRAQPADDPGLTGELRNRPAGRGSRPGRGGGRGGR